VARFPYLDDIPPEPLPDTAAFDFFTVPTATFRVLYCFLILSHDRRRIVHFNVCLANC
jgi:hypothetical protein